MAVIAVTAPFVMIILLVWFNANKKNLENKLKADLYSQAVEKGQPLPENFFAVNSKPKKNALRNGIICAAVGLGISLFFVAIYASGQTEALPGMSLGIIPFCVGVGFLLIHFLQEKPQNDIEK